MEVEDAEGDVTKEEWGVACSTVFFEDGERSHKLKNDSIF